MKTEWTQEPHVSVKWAVFEALRASDKASTVDYWDVVTENLIQGLALQQQWSYWIPEIEREGDIYVDRDHAVTAKHSYPANCNLVSRLVSGWKMEDSDD